MAFIKVYKFGALDRSPEFMRTFHNMKILVQTTGVEISSINVKSEIPNKTLENFTRTLLINSTHKK